MRNFDIEIDPCYLCEEEDILKICHGERLLQKLTAAWIPDAKEILPGFYYKWKHGSNYMRQYLSDFALPYYHWSGTCSMKSDVVPDDEYVVDEELRVRGTTNLYICDASVHPRILSVPPALTLAAMGLCASNIIKNATKTE
jgi:choline dehydrogenase-like flavoprotein